MPPGRDYLALSDGAPSSHPSWPRLAVCQLRSRSTTGAARSGSTPGPLLTAAWSWQAACPLRGDAAADHDDAAASQERTGDEIPGGGAARHAYPDR